MKLQDMQLTLHTKMFRIIVIGMCKMSIESGNYCRMCGSVVGTVNGISDSPITPLRVRDVCSLAVCTNVSWSWASNRRDPDQNSHKMTVFLPVRAALTLQ